MSINATLAPLPIASAQGNYSVDFVATVGDALAQVRELADPRLVVDRHVYELYEAEFAQLRGIPIHFAPATETEKTLAGVERLLGFLQETSANKKSTVVAVGGGIMQDLATFSSHMYYRGIPWMFIPTTLLSMSDSSIGAKCGINFGKFKNQLGVFQSPARIIICERFLETLHDDDVRSGYGEILKLVLTGLPRLYDKLETAVNSTGFRSPQLSELIRDSLTVKKAVIEEDEYETGYRRILNYGHTFCHSLESLTNHEVPHGLAVAWGVDVANFVAQKRGLLEPLVYARIHAFIQAHFSVAVQAPYDAKQIVAGMGRDKKAAAGQVSLILLAAPGDLRIVQTSLDTDLENDISEYLAHDDIFSRH